MDKVIVISIDAMIYEDIREFKKLPNFSRLFEHSSLVDKVHCIYPTYTYPCHTSIMTGCYPDKHGIYHNEICQPGAKHDEWLWYRSAIKRPTMLDAAKKAGLSTACITWPCQGGSDTDYLIAEIWAEDEEMDSTPVFDKANSKAVKHIFEKNKNKLDWMRTPGFDLFASSCASDIIRQFNPDLTFIHFSYLDHQRHRHGVETEKNIHAIEFIDERLGEIIQASKDAGAFDDTTFILLGDHGHINVDKVFNINSILAERGYITLDENGEIKDWRIFVHSASFSGHVYIQNISEDEALSVLEKIQKDFPGYIERIMTRFEVEEIYHLSGPFAFVLEAENNVIFGNDLVGDYVRKPEPGNYKFSLSTHGFAPEKGANPPFIVCGKRAKAGTRIKNARLVDEAPTILSIFGLSLLDIDGKKLDMID